MSKFNTTRLSVENLESREVMTANLTGGVIYVTATDLADNVKITQEVQGGRNFYRVTENGSQSLAVWASDVTANWAVVYGKGGNDVIDFDIVAGGTSRLGLIAYAGAGNDQIWGTENYDYLVGDVGNDTILGEGGDDSLYGNANQDDLLGGWGNDRLYGGDQTDYLYGEDGDDFLDGGNKATGANYFKGGRGTDFAADAPARNGTTVTDISQNQGATCWILSSLAAQTRRQGSMAGGIIQNGEGAYAVSLYNPSSSRWEWVSVAFNGFTNNGDPNPSITAAQRNLDAEGVDGEFWTIVYQRAILKLAGVDWTNESAVANASNLPAKSQQMLTGYTSTWVPNTNDQWFNGYQGDLRNAVSANRIVVAHSKASPSDNTIVGRHAYTVLDIDSNNVVTLYNPWGSTIRVSWATFAASFDGFTKSGG